MYAWVILLIFYTDATTLILTPACADMPLVSNHEPYWNMALTYIFSSLTVSNLIAAFNLLKAELHIHFPERCLCCVNCVQISNDASGELVLPDHLLKLK